MKELKHNINQLIWYKRSPIRIGFAKGTAVNLFVLFLVSEIGSYFFLTKITCLFEKHY